jgi:hypothetical protein
MGQASEAVPVSMSASGSANGKRSEQCSRSQHVPHGTAVPASTRKVLGQSSSSLRCQSWRRLVSASAEHFSPEADPAFVRSKVLSTIALPYNADIACDVVLAGMAMIIEHHRNCPTGLVVSDKLMEDLTGYVTGIAKQSGVLAVS